MTRENRQGKALLIVGAALTLVLIIFLVAWRFVNVIAAAPY